MTSFLGMQKIILFHVIDIFYSDIKKNSCASRAIKGNYLKIVLVMLNYLKRNKVYVCYVAFVGYKHFEK